jgi:hypothetical protein
VKAIAALSSAEMSVVVMAVKVMERASVAKATLMIQLLWRNQIEAWLAGGVTKEAMSIEENASAVKRTIHLVMTLKRRIILALPRPLATVAVGIRSERNARTTQNAPKRNENGVTTTMTVVLMRGNDVDPKALLAVSVKRTVRSEKEANLLVGTSQLADTERCQVIQLVGKVSRLKC